MSTYETKDTVDLDLKYYAGAPGKIVTVTGYYNTSDGAGGQFTWDASSMSPDNNGTVINPNRSAGFPPNDALPGRWKRVFSGNVNVRWFGARGDYSNSTLTGTDDTVVIQKAVNSLTDNNGGTLFFPRGRYVVNGTIYVNPNEQKPITLLGCVENTRDNTASTSLAATSIIRYANSADLSTTDDIIRVNLTKDGYNNLPGESLYTGFTIDGFNFFAKNGLSIRAIQVFRTRGTFRNLYCASMQYLIYQQHTDANPDPDLAIKNYCDQCTYENLRILKSTKGGIKLDTCDGSNVNGFYFEYPVAGYAHAIEIQSGNTTNINGVVCWCPPETTAPFPPFAPLSSLFKLDASFAINFNGIHIERSIYESVFEFNNCTGISVNGIDSRYECYDTFKISNSRGININNWLSWELKKDIPIDEESGRPSFDIRTIGNSDKLREITWEKCYFEEFNPDDKTTHNPRNIKQTGTELRRFSHGPVIHAHIYYDGTQWWVRDAANNILSTGDEPVMSAHWLVDGVGNPLDGLTLDAPFDKVAMILVSAHYVSGVGPALTPQVTQYNPVKIQFVKPDGTRDIVQKNTMNFDIIIATF